MTEHPSKQARLYRESERANVAMTDQNEPYYYAMKPGFLVVDLSPPPPRTGCGAGLISCFSRTGGAISRFAA